MAEVLAQLFQRQSNTCSGSKQYYTCASTGYKGCCSVDACANNGCPDDSDSDSSTTSTTESAPTTTSTPTTTTRPTSTTGSAAEVTITRETTRTATATAAFSGDPSSSSPVASSSPSASVIDDANSDGKSGSVNVGVVAGVVAAVVVLLLLLGACLYVRRRRQRKQYAEGAAELDAGNPFTGAAAGGRDVKEKRRWSGSSGLLSALHLRRSSKSKTDMAEAQVLKAELPYSPGPYDRAELPGAEPAELHSEPADPARRGTPPPLYGFLGGAESGPGGGGGRGGSASSKSTEEAFIGKEIVDWMRENAKVTNDAGGGGGGMGGAGKGSGNAGGGKHVMSFMNYQDADDGGGGPAGTLMPPVQRPP